MSGFKEFNRITTDYAEVLNVLFKDFIQFVALQYKGTLISSDDIKKLIDSESHNDLTITLNKYKQPIWQHRDLREDKFSLHMLLSQYNKLSYKKQNASIIQFIEAQEIGPRRINTICSIASSVHELRNKIAHGYYVKNEAEAAVYWSHLAQLVMSYPAKLIKKDDIKQKFLEMDNFIKGDLLHSWISFYQPEEEESDASEDISVPNENLLAENILIAIADAVDIMESHNAEVMKKITEIQHQPSTVEAEQEIEETIDDHDFEETPIITQSVEQLTESEARSQLKQLKNRIHKEMRFKHNKKMANWECIVQWAIIDDGILSHFPKNKDEFKKLDAFQKYYNSEQSKRATEADKTNAKSVMNFQVDEYWDDILEIIERTASFTETKN